MGYLLWFQPSYSLSLISSLSLSLGYGDLSATNVREMVYGIAVMVVGKLLFGFILGSIASTLSNLDTQRVLFEEKLSALKVLIVVETETVGLAQPSQLSCLISL